MGAFVNKQDSSNEICGHRVQWKNEYMLVSCNTLSFATPSVNWCYLVTLC